MAKNSFVAEVTFKYLDECIDFELRIDKKFVGFCLLAKTAKTPIQNRDEFEKLLENLESSIDHMADKNLYMMVVLGDFNAKSNSWYANDNTNIEGSKIDILTASFGFNQIINKPTHILNNSSSCINLIFTSQPNLVIKSGAHSSLHANCHHQKHFIMLM